MQNKPDENHGTDLPPGLEGKIGIKNWTLSGYSDSDMQLTEAWLAKNQAAFSALRHGASLPHYWPIYDNNTPIEASIVENELQALAQWRHVTFALKQQIAWEACRGDVAKALDDCLVLRRLGRHLQGKGSLNAQLVGVATESYSYDGIVAILSACGASAAVLEHVQKELAGRFDLDRRVIDLACEKTLWLDRIQRTFTDDGQGGGHALSKGFIYAAGNWRDNLINTFRFRYPDRRETVTMVDAYFQQAQRRLDALPTAGGRGDPNDPVQASTLNIMFSLVTPAYGRVGQLAWRPKTHELGVVTLLAIQRYFRANGSYPDSLTPLVERGFLQQPPKDPFSPGTLTYRKTDRGFLLYSWGTNLKDDGGQLGTDSHGQPRMWADNGDWVFWPPVNP